MSEDRKSSSIQTAVDASVQELIRTAAGRQDIPDQSVHTELDHTGEDVIDSAPISSEIIIGMHLNLKFFLLPKPLLNSLCLLVRSKMDDIWQYNFTKLFLCTIY